MVVFVYLLCIISYLDGLYQGLHGVNESDLTIYIVSIFFSFFDITWRGQPSSPEPQVLRRLSEFWLDACISVLNLLIKTVHL